MRTAALDPPCVFRIATREAGRSRRSALRGGPPVILVSGVVWFADHALERALVVLGPLEDADVARDERAGELVALEAGRRDGLRELDGLDGNRVRQVVDDHESVRADGDELLGTLQVERLVHGRGVFLPGLLDDPRLVVQQLDVPAPLPDDQLVVAEVGQLRHPGPVHVEDALAQLRVQVPDPHAAVVRAASEEDTR